MSNPKFRWDEQKIQMLREGYQAIGPTKLARMLGTSLASVISKARRLGIEPTRDNRPPAEWTEEMLATLHNLYTTADAATLVHKIGLPIYVIRRKAQVLGLRNTTGVQRRGQTRARGNTSCDYHYFDKWSPDMAYVLGFIFADGSITKRECDVVIGLAATDIAIVNFIKDELKSTRPLYHKKEWTDGDGYKHSEAVYLTLASTILVRRLMELGLKRRKTYKNASLPDMPTEMLPHFIRGFFDGDGTVFVADNGICRVSFVGPPRFIVGIRDALAEQADMSYSAVRVEKSKTCSWGRVSWSAEKDLYHFYNYVYPSGFTFCLARKKEVLDKRLHPAPKDSSSPWTQAEKRYLRRMYRKLGPPIMGKRLGRSVEAVTNKAKELGLR